MSSIHRISHNSPKDSAKRGQSRAECWHPSLSERDLILHWHLQGDVCVCSCEHFADTTATLKGWCPRVTGEESDTDDESISTPGVPGSDDIKLVRLPQADVVSVLEPLDDI